MPTQNNHPRAPRQKKIHVTKKVKQDLTPLDTIPEAKQKPKRSWRYLLLATTVILGSIAGVITLAFLFLLPNSLRLDEAQSVWQTSRSLPGMIKVVAEDVHVPLYHVLLHFWEIYFGQGVTTVRLMSLLLFVISIPVFYILTRQLLSKNWALVAVIFFSFSPFMNWYGSEARMYTLLALMSIISQIFFVRIIQHNKGWTGYLLSAMIGVYSHYFFFFTLFAQGIFYLFNRKDFKKGSFAKFIGVAIAVVISISPWLYYFRLNGSAGNTSPLLIKPSTVDFFNAFSQFAFGFQTNSVNTILVSTWPLLIIFGFFAIRRSQRIPKEILYMGVAAFVPVIAAYVISLTIKPFFESRYMVSVIPPLTILVVWFIAHYPKKLAITVTALIMASGIFGFYQQVVSPQTPVKENYSGAASYIKSNARAEDVVVLSAPFTVYPFQYYYDGDARVMTLPLWDRSVPGPIPAFNEATLPSQVSTINRDHTDTYLLLSQDQGYQSTIFQYYERNFQRIKVVNFSDKLDLYVYRVGYNMVPDISKLNP